MLILTNCGSVTKVKTDTLIIVKDIDLPKSAAVLTQFATHTFIDYRESVRSPWYRVEITHPKSGLVHKSISTADAYARMRWGERVRILSQDNGIANPNFVRDIKNFVNNYDDSVYKTYPGPNSNTFIEKIVREVKGISAILDHNAIGKENGFYAGKTSGGSGFKLQTPILGIALGLKEGVEVSVLGLSAGVSAYPPAIRIPFLPKLPTWE